MKMPEWLARWWRQGGCAHHWHPADAMIAWACCWCDKEIDGMPTDRTDACAYEGAGVTQ